MTTVFTDFVRNFETDSDIHDHVNAAILKALKHVLHHRGLFYSSPSLLGYAGSSWADEEVMSDLVFDCLQRSLVTRLRGLRGLLQKSGAIDGVVVLNIKNFVWEKQKKHDPVGYAVFQNLKAAAAHLVDADELRRLNAQDISAFNGNTVYSIKAASSEAVADKTQLKEVLLRSGLMFDGLQSFTTVGVKGQEILVETIKSLKGFGIASFSVNALKKALCSLISESQTVRPVTSHQIVSEVFEDSPENSRTVPQDAGYQESESHAHMVQQIHLEIDNSRRTQAVRKRLHQMLDLAAEAWSGKNSTGEFSVEGLQSTLGIERTTVYDDLKFLASLRERVMTQQSLTNKHGEQHG